MTTATPARASKGGLSGLSALATEVRKTLGKANPDIVFDPNRKVEFVSSGDLIFDAVCGGGWPRRRLSEVFGQEHSGKSSINYSTLAVNQRQKGIGILIDAETAWDPVYAKNVYGLVEDGETFIVFQPESYEEVDAIVEKLKLLPRLDVLVFDSVDAIKPKALIDRTADETVIPGMHAKAITHLVLKSRLLAKQLNTAVIFINQMRVNMIAAKFEQNVGTGAGFNPNETYTVTGGAALRYYGSLRVKLEYGGQLQDEMGENVLTKEQEKLRIGNYVKVINIKNKVATPFLKGMAQFHFPMPGKKGGWSRPHEILDLLKKRGHIAQVSTRFTYKGLNKEWSNIGSKVASEELFMQNAELMADAEALIKSFLTTPESTTQVLEMATVGVDLTSEDQDDQMSDNSKLGLQLSNLIGKDQLAPLDDTTPTSEVSL